MFTKRSFDEMMSEVNMPVSRSSIPENVDMIKTSLIDRHNRKTVVCIFRSGQSRQDIPVKPCDEDVPLEARPREGLWILCCSGGRMPCNVWHYTLPEKMFASARLVYDGISLLLTKRLRIQLHFRGAHVASRQYGTAAAMLCIVRWKARAHEVFKHRHHLF